MANELSEREKNLVGLINQLSEYANDETTTQAAIEHIIANIHQTTNDNIQQELNDIDNEPERGNIEFPSGKMSDEIKNTIVDERQKMIDDVMKELNGGGHKCNCGQINQMFFTRIREVKAPGKAHVTDAGIDFYVPEEKSWDDDFKKMVIDYSKNPSETMVRFEVDEDTHKQVLIVEPNAHVAIPSGIKTIIPTGLGMMFVNKSGIATKKKLDHSACLVDSEYRDEVIMCFFNHSTTPIVIEPGMKITQGLIVPIINMQIQEVLNCVYDDMGKDTDRGGGFGSSGTK